MKLTDTFNDVSLAFSERISDADFEAFLAVGDSTTLQSIVSSSEDLNLEGLQHLLESAFEAGVWMCIPGTPTPGLEAMGLAISTPDQCIVVLLKAALAKAAQQAESLRAQLVEARAQASEVEF